MKTQNPEQDGLPCCCLFNKNNHPLRECALHKAWREALEWYAEKAEQAAYDLGDNAYKMALADTTKRQLLQDAGKRAKDALEA